MNILGIDIGGSGIKGAPVDLATGEFVGERHRIETPEESTPEAVAEIIAEIVNHFNYHGPIGCTFPGVVQHGVIYTAANVDKSWIEVDADSLFEEVSGCPVTVLNDADAAGIAEMEFGVGRDQKGVVMMLTLGTGIGTAIFTNGQLLPNTEFGHFPMPGGQEAEHLAAGRIRKDEGLSWKEWAKRVNDFLLQMEFFFSPDLFIIGGGISRKHDKFLPRLTTRAKVIPAQLRNQAGIVGAAMAAKDLQG